MSRIAGLLLCTAAAIILCAGPLASEQISKQTVPRDVPQAPEEQNSGSSLSSRLDQTDGVIRPPSGIDPGAVRPPPPAGKQSTPVIPPPGSAGGDENLRPK
jgi:hypothetical protein